MLYFDGIDFSEGIDVKKASESKGCDICNHWYFLDKISSSNQMFGMDAMIY